MLSATRLLLMLLATTQDTTPSRPAELVFWRQLGDTTLDRLMTEGLRANQDVRAAEARVRGARAARLGAVLDLAPTVTAGGGFVRQRLPRAAFPSGSVTGSLPDQSIWDGGFDASWELDFFGRLRHGVKAAGEFASAARAELRDVQVSLLAELARGYFELRGGEGLLAVARRNAENQRNTLEVTRQRLEAGRGTAFDTERAQAQLSFTLASIPALEAAVASARYRVAVLVGRSPASLVLPSGDSTALPALPAFETVSNPDSVISARPDVLAAERRVAAERALVGAAKADYLPRISLGGSAGFSSNTLDSFGKNGTFRYAVGPGISWPLLNLGRVKAGVDASQARSDEAAAQFAQTMLLAREDLENALVRYRSARERVTRVEEAAASSRRAAELARLRFSDGVADFLQVLDAERTQLDAESQLAQGRTAAATAYAALYKALGGVWSASPRR
ncbi:MAG TPA: TolC family protein [Gemmatimonadales bacterium]|jgi:NodT family efflux transporter outer membrane factor (OMF) lipoprotein|nr:TolC family protein [Gemmatimonadales bacterium]